MSQHQFDLAVESIRVDRQSGASELARKCLSILAESACYIPADNAGELKKKLIQQATHLATIRPSMTPIENLVNRWYSTVSLLPESDLSVMREQAVRAANQLIKQIT